MPKFPSLAQRLSIDSFAQEKAEAISRSFIDGNRSWCADQIAEMGPSLAALVVLHLWALQSLNAGDRRVLRSLLCDKAADAGTFIAPDSLMEN